MNYKKIILVGFISAFVAILTSVLGVAGTIIGSVISSMLYNMLSEALEKPVSQATFSTDFEWEIAYIFPLVVIAFIQLILIFALLSEFGLLPYTFVNVYLSIQDLANNNLYRLLGLALLIISAYPLILKPEFVKKEHGALLVFVALIFLARGFVDLHNPITNIYDGVFAYFDLPIAIIAFLIIVFVIVRILISARNSEKEFKIIKHSIDDESKEIKINSPDGSKAKRRHYAPKNEYKKVDRHNANQKPKSNIRFKSSIDDPENKVVINESVDNIQFESNDLLDEYKK